MVNLELIRRMDVTQPELSEVLDDQDHLARIYFFKRFHHGVVSVHSHFVIAIEFQNERKESLGFTKLRVVCKVSFGGGLFDWLDSLLQKFIVLPFDLLVVCKCFS